MHHEAGRAEQSGPVTEAQHVVAAYWAAAEARDWQAFGGLVADDVVYEGPQTREQASSFFSLARPLRISFACRNARMH